MNEPKQIIAGVVLKHYLDIQAIYLFGSFGTGTPWPHSDIDIGLLLPFPKAGKITEVDLSECRFELERDLKRSVDLINVRRVSTVFRKEIIFGERIFCADRHGADEFEMLTLSFYQKLNAERAAILAAFEESGRAYAV